MTRDAGGKARTRTRQGQAAMRGAGRELLLSARSPQPARQTPAVCGHCVVDIDVRGNCGKVPSASGEKDHRHQGQSTGLDGQMALLYKDCCSAGTEVSDPLKGMQERKSIH